MRRDADTLGVILAGGLGTRLRPLTDARPKPVVPLLNRPFLDYQLALLRRHGVRDVVLSCSYRVDDVRSAMGTGAAAGVGLRYAVEDAPLGTGGGVRNAAHGARGRLLVLNGDVLTDVDLGAVLRFHAARGARATIGLIPVEDPTRYGLVETDGRGAVRRFLEKPRADEVTTNMVNAGIYVIEAELLERIPSGRAVSIEREFFPGLVSDGVPFFGCPLTGYWRDIGSPVAYREAQRDLLCRRVATPLDPAGTPREGCWVAAGARLEPGATLAGPAVIGAGVWLAAGASIGPFTVVGAGARIGAGARLEAAVLWEGVEVGAGAVLRDCIVASHAVVGARAEVGSDSVLGERAVVPERPPAAPAGAR